MKPSKFNFFYPYKDDSTKTIAFNARTSSLSLLDSEHYSVIKNFIETNEDIQDTEFERDLQNCGYILKDDIDEMELIRLSMLRGRYSSRRLSLIIAPTMACDFRCVYCFERNNFKDIVITEEVIKGILRMINERINIIDNLNITWYGGEPLLAFDMLEKLTKKIIELCTENNVTYRAEIITNGYNLNRDFAKKFEELNIMSMQITLDGPEDIHDKRRVLSSGQGTFNKIITNLSDCISDLHATNINIRVNTDKENLYRINEVMNELQKHNLSNKVNVYLGLVEPTNGNYEENKCLSVYEFSKKNVDFKKNVNSNIMPLYPRRVQNFCGADNDSTFVIDSEGYLYKCWNDIGMIQKSIGSVVVDDYNDANTKLLLNYMLYDPTQNSQCRDCKVLPLCMGGCPSKRLSNSEGCSQYKYILEECLGECTSSIILNRNNEAVSMSGNNC